MILYYTCRQEPSIIITREASSSTGWEQMKRPTATYQAEVRESCKRGGGRILEGRSIKDTASTGLTESTNLTQSHGGSKSLNKEPKSVQTLDPVHVCMCICIDRYIDRQTYRYRYRCRCRYRYRYMERDIAIYPEDLVQTHADPMINAEVSRVYMSCAHDDL